MTLLPVSATKTADCVAAMPAGRLKTAAVPVPSTAVPLSAPPPAPASVVTARVAKTTTRILLFPVSATKSLALSNDRHSAAGLLKALFVPTPSAHVSSPDPANVVVAPLAGDTVRILLLPESAINSGPAPPAAAATPCGALKAAAEPTPSAKLGSPGWPASVAP